MLSPCPLVADKSPTGKVVTQWHSANLHYRFLTKLLGRVSEKTSQRQMT